MTDPSADLARLDAMYQAGQISPADYAVARAQLQGAAAPPQGLAATPPPWPAAAPPPVFTPAPYAPTMLPGGSGRRGVYESGYGFGRVSVARRLVFGLVPLVVTIVVVIVVAVVVNKSTKTPPIAAPSISVPGISLSFSAPELPGGVNSFAGTSKQPAHLGDTVVIKDDDGHAVSVTLLKIAATTKSTDSFSVPDAGNRFYAAELRIGLAADADPYSDSPGFGAEALDAAGHQYDNALTLEKISSGPLFPDTTKIAPGQSAVGWIAFEVPTATTVTAVQFFLDGGAGDGAQWAVP